MPRGGARAGAGRKKKPLFDKLLEGNPGKRALTTVQFDNLPAVKQTTELVPPSFLTLASKETAETYPSASQIFNDLAGWLETTGCLTLVSPMLIEDFAVYRRAMFECEYMNKRLGRIAGGKISPYVNMVMNYSNLMRSAWDRIWMIVSQNSDKPYSGSANSGEDVMELLLTRRRTIPNA
ncbi:hypothetical protein FACS1894184_09370 [Clostridia bacterium]|nr:hypothetical protein FACS1894184_09370 [Clostridia bacterium]